MMNRLNATEDRPSLSDVRLKQQDEYNYNTAIKASKIHEARKLKLEKTDSLFV